MFKNILITGGGGFVGSHLAEHFLTRGHNVICIDNFCTGFKDNRKYLENLDENLNCQKLLFLEEDVSAPWAHWLSRIEKNLLSGVSHVFHFASPASPIHYQRLCLETLWVNSVGMKNALEFADSVKARLIFSSTSEVYGDPHVSPQSESYYGNVNSFGVRSCYDEAKRFGEALIYSHNIRYKTQHGLVRIFNTYGPRMNPVDNRVVINFLQQGLKGESITMYGDGKQTRSFCYISDLIEGILKYAETKISIPINIGNDSEHTILELAEMVKTLFPEKKLQIIFEPLPQDDPLRRRPDLTLAKNKLAPWQPKIALKEGLSKMLEALKGHELTVRPV